MSVIMTIEVEEQNRDVLATMPPADDGYQLPKIMDDLDEIARSQGVPPLSRFIQQDADALEEMAAAMEDLDMDVPDYEAPDPDAWHDSAEALCVVQTILLYLRDHPELIEERWGDERRICEDEIVPELEGFERRLEYLASRQVRFRFDVG
jgi:hypothetical protein